MFYGSLVLLLNESFNKNHKWAENSAANFLRSIHTHLTESICDPDLVNDRPFKKTILELIYFTYKFIGTDYLYNFSASENLFNFLAASIDDSTAEITAKVKNGI